MKRTPLLLVAAVVLVVGALGWLARAWLRTEPVAVAPIDDPTARNTSRRDPETATPTPTDASPTGPTAVRKEEPKPVKPTALEPNGAPGSIVGRVLNPQNEVVPGAEVELMRGPAMGLQLRTLNTETGLIVQTDAEGRYRFGGVDPNDDYLVFASHPDFGNCEAGPIVVPAGKEAQVADIRLRVGIHIQGTVTSNGRPVEGATVTVSNAMDRIRRFNPGPLKDRLKELDLEQVDVRTLTNAAGHYEFLSVPFDTFEITAEADGLARMSKNSQGNFLGGSAREHKIDFELGAAARITGRVVDDSHNGVEGAKVSATIANQTFRCEVTALSDGDGRFALEHLAEGTYFLSAECEGYSAATRAQVETGTADLQIEMLVQGSVSGVVVDEETGAPITDFELSVLANNKGRGPATAREHLEFHDAGGRFEVKNLDPGRFAIQASVVDYADSTSDEFEVTRGQLTSGVRVPMNRGGGIAGIVVDRSGKPIKNALIQVRENLMKDNPVRSLFGPLAGGDKVSQTRSGDDGSFRIELIVPDTYQIMVKHNKFAQLEVNDVQIAKGGVKEMGRLELRRGGKVSGHAYDLEGRPLAGATIVAVSKASDYRNARSNNDGFYELPGLPVGEYTITINSYQSNPPINTLTALVYAKNSAQKCQIVDEDDLNVDLRLSSVNPAPGRNERK